MHSNLDHDDVEESNLQRQVIHSLDTLSVNKAASAAIAVHKLSESCSCDVYPHAFTPEKAMDLVSRYDLVMDASDNPGLDATSPTHSHTTATRYLVNDACVLSDTPLVSASALRMEGQLSTYAFKGGPCYRWYLPFSNLTMRVQHLSQSPRPRGKLQRRRHSWGIPRTRVR